MYKQLALVILNVAGCLSLATYEQFRGFDTSDTDLEDLKDDTTEAAGVSNTFFSNTNSTSTTAPVTTQVPPNVTATTAKFECPEEEEPSNIGPYEVPTQRDLTLQTRKTLKKMFGSYHQKALLFLEDIKKATRATVDVEHKCQTNRGIYRKCVRHVSNQCEAITKSLVISLERQRHDVAAFSESSICSMREMKADPVKLIKVLAMEEASLDFALPAFLRLLSACSKYCLHPFSYFKKPLRKLSDTDLVIKEFLTRKNYKQLT